jgi:uncharacterized membrane protein
MIIIGGILLIGLLSGVYYSWRSSITRQALLEYNQKQLEQTLKDQEEFRLKMQAIQKNQEELIKKNREDKKEFDDKMASARSYLESDEAKKEDRSSSQVLKQTIKKLKDAPK